MRRFYAAVSVLIICLLLSSCGIKASIPTVKNNADIEDKYTQVSYSAEDMVFSEEDFLFFKLSDFLDDWSAPENSIICLSPGSSVTYNAEGMKDNGFALSTSRIVAPADSDKDDFYSAYSIADECALICYEDKSILSGEQYIIASSETDSTTELNTRITIGSYTANGSNIALDANSIASVLGYETSETPLVNVPDDGNILLISAYTDADENITQIRVYSGTLAVLRELRGENLAELAPFIAQAEEKALNSEETSADENTDADQTTEISEEATEVSEKTTTETEQTT